jgi:hypothetical protein
MKMIGKSLNGVSTEGNGEDGEGGEVEHPVERQSLTYTVCLLCQNILGETNRLIIPSNQSKLICKCAKRSALEEEKMK